MIADVWRPFVAPKIMVVVPKPYPESLRRNVLAAQRYSETPLAHIANDFGISQNTITNCIKKARIQDGIKPDTTSVEPSGCAI